ncbi:MAG: site-specific integrase [Alphaproteobacteria bacterium]|nr:site-specific integrase [Alphaproteobacteria bacterium]
MRTRDLALVMSEPCFGALEDSGRPLREITLDDRDRAPSHGLSQRDRLYRVQVRAALFASPNTPCSAREVADVLGVRKSVVRALRPAELRAYGRSCKAPFGAWVAALHATAPTLRPTNDAAPERRARRAGPRRDAASPLLKPLGGPKARWPRIHRPHGNWHTNMNKSTRPKPAEVGEVRLTVTRGPRCDGRWYWRARRKALRDTLWTGWATRDEAMQAVAELVAEGLVSATPEDDPRTLNALLSEWMAHQRRRRDLSPSAVTNYHKACRHIVAWLGELPLDALKLVALERYRGQRLAEGAAPRVVALEFRVLHIAWRWAGLCGLAPERPLPRVKVRVRGYVANHHTPRPEDVSRVLEVLRGEHALAVRILASTGARISELAGLKRRDLDLRTRALRFEGKTGPRSFPLPEALVPLLQDRADGSDVPLLDFGRSGLQDCVRGALARACARAGVPRFTPHGLRRMVVDQMIRAGVDVATAASLTGHSVEVMLRHYRTVSEADRREAVTRAGLGVLT